MLSKQKSDDVNVMRVFRFLLSKSLIIILVSLITAIIALVGTIVFIAPKYEAKASFLVNNSSFSFGATSFSISSSEITASNSLVDTYIYILQSRTTLENVISEAGLQYNYEALSRMVKSNPGSGSGTFEVVVESTSPQEAELIANTIARVLPERISELVDGSSVRIVDYAIIPAHRSSPNYVVNSIKGFALGCIISCAFAVVKMFNNDSEDDIIHSADELKELFPRYHVLSLIPDMQMAKKGAYYTSYYDSKNRGRK